MASAETAWDNAITTYIRHHRFWSNNVSEEVLRDCWDEEARRAYRQHMAVRHRAMGVYMPSEPLGKPLAGQQVQRSVFTPPLPTRYIPLPPQERPGGGSVPLL